MARQFFAGDDMQDENELTCKLGICFETCSISEGFRELFLNRCKSTGCLAVVVEHSQESLDGTTRLVNVLALHRLHGGGHGDGQS